MNINELKKFNEEIEKSIDDMFRHAEETYRKKINEFIEEGQPLKRNPQGFFDKLEILIRNEGHELYEKCFFNEEDLSIHTKLHDFHDHEVWCEKVMIADWKTPEECLELIKWLYK